MTDSAVWQVNSSVDKPTQPSTMTKGAIKASDVQWKNGNRDQAISTLSNQFQKDKNIVLIFKMAERLAEDRKFREAIDVLQQGQLLVVEEFENHPRAQELQIRLLMNLADVSRQRNFFMDANGYLEDAKKVANGEIKYLDSINEQVEKVKVEQADFASSKAA